MKGIDVHPYYQRGMAIIPDDIHYMWVKVSDGDHPYTKVTGSHTYSPIDLVTLGRDQGVSVGGYHYAQHGDPIQQANMFITECERLGAVQISPALDLEDPFLPDWTARNFGEAFCNQVRLRGYQPTVYMNNSMARSLRPQDWTTKPLLWIARYSSIPDVPYHIHQFSSSALVSGVTCDVNESIIGIPPAHPNQAGTPDMDTNEFFNAEFYVVDGSRKISVKDFYATTLAEINNLRREIVTPQPSLVDAAVERTMLGFVQGVDEHLVRVHQEIDAHTQKFNDLNAKLDNIASTLATLMPKGTTIA